MDTSLIACFLSYLLPLQFQISSNPGAGRKVFFINCGIHAREWVTPATCMIMIRQVCSLIKQVYSIRKTGLLPNKTGSFH